MVHAPLPHTNDKCSEARNSTELACNTLSTTPSGVYVPLNLGLGTVSILFACLRLIFKRFYGPTVKLGADDWVICGALAIGLPCIVINITGLSAHGLGRDSWTLPLEEVSTFAFYFYVLEVLYLAEIALIKLSLSIFYLHVFPGTTIKHLLLATAIFNVAFGVAFPVAAIFQCTPVHYYWTRYSSTRSGSCIDIGAFGWANASLSVAVDLWMLVIPLSQVPRLRLHWVKKIGVAIMFFVGTL